MDAWAKKYPKVFICMKDGKSVLEDGEKVVDEDIFQYIKIPQPKEA